MVIDCKKQGKKNRAAGQIFENRVRIDLEKKGWIVDRWTMNVEIYDAPLQVGFKIIPNQICKLIPAKPKIRMAKTMQGFLPVLMNTYTGFPDFVCYKPNYDEIEHVMDYDVQAVECKINGKLSKIEKQKCSWMLKNGIFMKILIASKDGRKIKYTEYKE